MTSESVSTRAEVHYIPILKGRLGEFRALQEVDEPLVGRFTPLIEVVPSAVEFDDEGDVDRAAVSRDLMRFVERLTTRWARGRRVIVDTGLLPSPPGPLFPAVELLIECSRRDYPVVPTVRPSDSDDLIRSVGEQLREHSLWGACIRLAGEDLDDTDTPLPDALDRVLGLLATPAAGVDLVLDFGVVPDERAAIFAARIARLVLSELPLRDQWHTLTVAAGAFPSDLSSVPPHVLTELPRFDLALWQRVCERAPGRTPTFGDYGIAHPVQASAAGFAPAPQLRYTAQLGWLVMKGRRRDRRAHAQFFDICSRIATHGEFTPGLSWGDRLISAAAFASTQDDPDTSPGNAMLWRAIGTSHHIAHVIDRLANEVGA